MQPKASNDLPDDVLVATAELLPRARAGEPEARAELFARYAPALRRFLHARLPTGSRTLLETDDLVQEVCASALGALDRFEYRGPGSFWCYLRRIGLNAVAQIARRPSVHSPHVHELDLVEPARGAPEGELASLIDKERFSAFEKALECVSEQHREALLLRLELSLSYEAIARECDYPSADAARMGVCRSIERVVAAMTRDGFSE